MCCCCVSLFLCCSCLVSILFLSLPHSLWFSLCFSLFSVFCTQPCSEVQEICVVAVFLSSSAVRVLSLSSFLVSRTLSGSLFASPSSLCFLYVRLILNCERIAIKYAAALLYIIPSISYQVPYSSIIHSRSGVTDGGLLYHTRSLAVRM